MKTQKEKADSKRKPAAVKRKLKTRTWGAAQPPKKKEETTRKVIWDPSALYF